MNFGVKTTTEMLQFRGDRDILSAGDRNVFSNVR